MPFRSSAAVPLALIALATHGEGLRLSREDPDVAKVMPAKGPDGCPVVSPMCASVGTSTTTYQQWKPTCQGGKWVCGEAPKVPEPEVSPCIIEPPKPPADCPMARPMCMSLSGKSFPPTCHKTEDGKNKWLCEEPQSENPGLSKQCCRAMSAKCLACAAGQTLEEYCQDKPEAAGCPEEEPQAAACCRGMTKECLACAAGQTVEEYCEEDPWAAGCEEEDEADAREYVLVKRDKKCGKKKQRLTRSAESEEECAALAVGAGFDAFMLGKGFRRGKCYGMKLEVTAELWGAYENSKRDPPCPSGWKPAKGTDFYVFEPKL